MLSLLHSSPVNQMLRSEIDKSECNVQPEISILVPSHINIRAGDLTKKNLIPVNRIYCIRQTIDILAKC